MEDYNFWADLLTSYRASPDSIKAMWLMVPLLLAAGFFALTVAAAMRLMDRREASPMQAGEERSDAEWLTAVSLPPLIEHERTDRQPPR
ncbi:MAG TPA: hypothetical protein PL183_07130 [Aquamicrobium sp.]|nr:hypothetical protein [Aquamicrobium sp.]